MESKKNENEKFLKVLAGFFLTVVIYLIIDNPIEVINGFIDALK